MKKDKHKEPSVPYWPSQLMTFLANIYEQHFQTRLVDWIFRTCHVCWWAQSQNQIILGIIPFSEPFRIGMLECCWKILQLFWRYAVCCNYDNTCLCTFCGVWWVFYWCTVINVYGSICLGHLPVRVQGDISQKAVTLIVIVRTSYYTKVTNFSFSRSFFCHKILSWWDGCPASLTTMQVTHKCHSAVLQLLQHPHCVSWC
jgi:hypothetical protein